MLPPAPLPKPLRTLLLAPLTLVVALAASAPAQASPLACAGAGVTAGEASQETVSEAVRCLVNAQRSARRLARVEHAAALRRAAATHARDMVRRSFFAHVSPTGSTLAERARRAGYPGSTLGENIGWGTGSLGTPDAIVEAFKKSPPHLSNILHPGFRELGVGVTLCSPADRSAPGAVYVLNLGRR